MVGGYVWYVCDQGFYTDGLNKAEKLTRNQTKLVPLQFLSNQ